MTIRTFTKHDHKRVGEATKYVERLRHDLGPQTRHRHFAEDFQGSEAFLEATQDQFKVTEAYESQKVKVKYGSYEGEDLGNTGDIQWSGSLPLPTGTFSDEYELEYGITSYLWARHFLNPPFPYSDVVVLFEGETPDAADDSLLIATISVDVSGQVTELVQDYSKPDGTFEIEITPERPTIVGCSISGGIYQKPKEDESSVIFAPSDGDFTWGPFADTSHSMTWSRPFEGTGVVWAALIEEEDSSGTSSGAGSLVFYMFDEGVDPPWDEADKWWKVATTSFEYDTEDSSGAVVTKVRVKQHYQGGLTEQEAEVLAPIYFDCFGESAVITTSAARMKFVTPYHKVTSDDFGHDGAVNNHLIDIKTERPILVHYSALFKLEKTDATPVSWFSNITTYIEVGSITPAQLGGSIAEGTIFINNYPTDSDSAAEEPWPAQDYSSITLTGFRTIAPGDLVDESGKHYIAIRISLSGDNVVLMEGSISIVAA